MAGDILNIKVSIFNEALKLCNLRSSFETFTYNGDFINP